VARPVEGGGGPSQSDGRPMKSSDGRGSGTRAARAPPRPGHTPPRRPGRDPNIHTRRGGQHRPGRRTAPLRRLPGPLRRCSAPEPPVSLIRLARPRPGTDRAGQFPGRTGQPATTSSALRPPQRLCERLPPPERARLLCPAINKTCFACLFRALWHSRCWLLSSDETEDQRHQAEERRRGEGARAARGPAHKEIPCPRSSGETF
jgi:hypothetical protein